MALAKSGWKSAHWIARKLRIYVGRAMYRRLYEGADPLLDFASFDAITQADLISINESYWPQLDPIMMASIRKHHQC
jgi:hypothetical protein